MNLLNCIFSLFIGDITGSVMKCLSARTVNCGLAEMGNFCQPLLSYTWMPKVDSYVNVCCKNLFIAIGQSSDDFSINSVEF
jgi:hypothetical protein